MNKDHAIAPRRPILLAVIAAQGPACQSIAASIGVAVFSSIFFAVYPVTASTSALNDTLVVTLFFATPSETTARPHMPDTQQRTQPHLPEDPRGLHIAGDNIGRQLQEIAILTREAASHLGAALGLNQTDLAAMEQLITHGPLPPTELATRLDVTTAGITQVIDRLERAGHVVRERQVDDKRRVLVRPMQTSIAQTYRHIAPMLNGLDAVLNALDGKKRKVIEQFLGQVIDVYRATLPVTRDSTDAAPSLPDDKILNTGKRKK